MTQPTLCLDFDGVIHSYTSGWKGPRTITDPPVEGAIDFLAEAILRGWRVVIHSSRSGYFGGIWAMRRYVKKHAGYRWYETPLGPGIESVDFVRYKPPAFVTLDDRAITFRGKWPDLADLRKFKPWNKT